MGKDDCMLKSRFPSWSSYKEIPTTTEWGVTIKYDRYTGRPYQDHEFVTQSNVFQLGSYRLEKVNPDGTVYRGYTYNCSSNPALVASINGTHCERFEFFEEGYTQAVEYLQRRYEARVKEVTEEFVF